MSWTMWHVYGSAGFDLARVKPAKYRDFIRNHEQSLRKSYPKLVCDKLMDLLSAAPEPDLEQVYEATIRNSLAEPVSNIMWVETGMHFVFPGLTDESEDYLLFTAAEPWHLTPAEKNLKSLQELLDIMRPYADELCLRLKEDIDLIYAG